MALIDIASRKRMVAHHLSGPGHRTVLDDIRVSITHECRRPSRKQ